MKKTKKIIFIIALLAMVLGGAILMASLIAINFDFTKMDTGVYVDRSYELDSIPVAISVNVNTAKVEIVKSTDGKCRVEIHERENITHTVSENNGELKISVVGTRKWYENIGINLKEIKITLYLPEGSYNYLKIRTDTGDATVSDGFLFDTIILNGDTADFELFSGAVNKLEAETDTGSVAVDGTGGRVSINTDTGNITIRSSSCAGIGIETDTGRITMENVNCEFLKIDSDTGKAVLKSVIATGRFDIESDTGDISFDGCDAEEISIETDTGDVEGTVLTDKTFVARSRTGDVWVPRDTVGGKCYINSSTGDIELSVKK